MWNTDKVLTIFNENREQSMQWFHQNYPSMIQWCRIKGGIRKWKSLVGRKTRRLLNEEEVIKILKINKDKMDTWFNINDPSIVQWCSRPKNGGWDYWVDKIGIKRKEKWTPLSVMNFLSNNKDKSFDWFKEQDGLISWCSTHGGWRKWAEVAHIKCKTHWNEQKVLKILTDNKEKSLMWFIHNEQALTKWCYRHGGLKHWAKIAGVI